MYINLHQNRVSIDQSKPYTQSYLRKIVSCIIMQLTIRISKTKLLSDMNHRITYLHLNFQQNRVSRSVKTVHTNLFAKNCKLHQLQLEFRKIKPFGHALPPHGHSGRF